MFSKLEKTVNLFSQDIYYLKNDLDSLKKLFDLHLKNISEKHNTFENNLTTNFEG